MTEIMFKLAAVLLFAAVAIAFTAGFINVFIDFWKCFK